MASYEKQVYYSKIDYQKKMNETKKMFIEDKYNNIDNDLFNRKIDAIWLTISHDYMQQTIQEQTQKIMDEDHVTMKKQQALPNRYKLNPISKFTNEEKKYGTFIKNSFDNMRSNDSEFLTQIIKKFEEKYERRIPYYKNGEIYSMHTPAEYLSMLYNVNLRMASWNQTIKDGQVLGIDLVVLQQHPNACETCLEHMGKLYSISGKEYNIPNFGGSIEDAYEDGVGHPNCKCNFSLFWDNSQLIQEPTIEQYAEVQKGRALKRDIDRYSIDYELYRYIGNEKEADKTIDKIDKLQSLLNELLVLYGIEPYIF